MQVAYAVILTLALVLGVNSLPGTSKKHLLHKYIPRHQLGVYQPRHFKTAMLLSPIANYFGIYLSSE
jgi:hypothetical protein